MVRGASRKTLRRRAKRTTAPRAGKGAPRLRAAGAATTPATPGPQVRLERDSLGEMEVPADVYYGASTARAVPNFPISGLRFPQPFIRALGLIKRAAAEANVDLGLLERPLGAAIVTAATEVAEGKLDDQFVLDIFQTGSGTSTNMNANEVIANRAIEILGGKIGSKSPVHPNDHVNLGQSSNDVIPTAMHLASLQSLEADLLPSLRRLEKALAKKAQAFDGIVKIGRTHLQDATPVRLGQDISGYAIQIAHRMLRDEALRGPLWHMEHRVKAEEPAVNKRAR